MNIEQFEIFLSADECLDYRADHPEKCAGPVELRPAMSPTGKMFPRCEHHFDIRLDEQERIVRDYGGQMFYDGYTDTDYDYDYDY